MPDIDINALMSAIVGGVGAYAAVRADVKYLLKIVEKLEIRIEKLEETKGR